MAEITQAEKQNRKRQNLEYPLNNPDDYLGRLKFTVVKEPETDLGNMLDFVKNTVGIGAKGIKDTATEEQTTEGAVEKTQEELQKGNLGTYQELIDQAQQYVDLAIELLNK